MRRNFSIPRNWNSACAAILPRVISEALTWRRHTLQKMAKGGIYDQLGGGFCRYSTDQYWRIPHFEKMLYDNGPLLRLYADAWLATRNPLVQADCGGNSRLGHARNAAPGDGTQASEAAERAITRRWMPIPKTRKANSMYGIAMRCATSCRPEEYAVVASLLRPSGDPNFEDKHWNLEIVQPTCRSCSKAIGISVEEAQQKLASARRKLFIRAELRVHPGRDEKILTSWNGLMIKGMAPRGPSIRTPGLDPIGRPAVDFIRSTLWKNNRLLATYKDGKAHLNAYLDDYAFLLDGLLELMQAEFRQTDLDFAVALADVLLGAIRRLRRRAVFSSPATTMKTDSSPQAQLMMMPCLRATAWQHVRCSD